MALRTNSICNHYLCFRPLSLLGWCRGYDRTLVYVIIDVSYLVTDIFSDQDVDLPTKPRDHIMPVAFRSKFLDFRVVEPMGSILVAQPKLLLERLDLSMHCQELSFSQTLLVI
jgi:hypothetical protein